MATSIVKQPQNREVTVAVLAALDANIGKYFTVDEENEFLGHLSDTHDFVWEGKGHWNDKHHNHETLRRVLNRLAQDRRVEFRDLPGDDKAHDRIHGLFRIGSALIKPERLRDYGYVRDEGPDADGRRKRPINDLLEEFRQAIREHQASRKSHSQTVSHGPSRRGRASLHGYPSHRNSLAPPPRKKLRASYGPRPRRADGTIAPSRRSLNDVSYRTARAYKKTRRIAEKTRNSSPRGARRHVADSDDDESSSEYEDALQYEEDAMDEESDHAETNGNGYHGRQPSGREEVLGERIADRRYHEANEKLQPSLSADNYGSAGLSNYDRADARSAQDPVLMRELFRLNRTIEKLADVFFPSQHDLEPAVLAHDGSEALRALYSLTFGTNNWQTTAGALLESQALSARDFLSALIWSFLRTNLLTQSFPETPLWSLLDETNLSHQFLRQDMENGTSAGSSAAADLAEGNSTGWSLMRQFLRRVAFRQLQHDKKFHDAFLQPAAWERAFQLRSLLHAHAPGLVAFRDMASPALHSGRRRTANGDVDTTNALPADAQVQLLCKEACMSALALRGRLQISAERFEWIWVPSLVDADPRRMVATSGSELQRTSRIALGVMPGLRWLPPEDDDEGSPGDGHYAGGPGMVNGNGALGRARKEWRVVRAMVRLMSA